MVNNEIKHKIKNFLSHLLKAANGGPRLPLLFTSHSYRHLEGHFLAEMAGKLNWLEWQGKKLVQKRPVGGTKCVK